MITAQVPESILARMAILAKTLSNAMIKGMGFKGVSIFIANGAAAGQRAPHIIMHVIPRMENDSARLEPGEKEIDQTDVLETLRKSIQRVI